MPAAITNLFTGLWNLAKSFLSLIWNWTTVLNLCTIGTFAFGFRQWKTQNNLNRASYAKMMMDDIRNNEEVIDVLHVIEYSDGNVKNDYWYNKSFHNNKDIEAKFDRVFAYFDYLCYLKEKKIIEEDEFKMIEYKLNRIGHDKNSLNYLFNLYHFAKDNNTTMSFSYLVNYLKEAGYIVAEDFTNINSPHYELVLDISE